MSDFYLISNIAVLVGLIISILTPVVKLNTTITKLNTQLDSLEKNITDFESSNRDAHKRLWEKNDEQDDILKDHETRLTVIEKKQ